MPGTKIGKIKFTEGHTGDLACPHRDLSVCEVCFADTEGLVCVGGQVYVEDSTDPLPDQGDPDNYRDFSVYHSGPTARNLARAERLRKIYAAPEPEIAWGRKETESCEAGTVGCSVLHGDSRSGPSTRCETW